MSIAKNLQGSLRVERSSNRSWKLRGRLPCLRALATYNPFLTPPATKFTSARHSLEIDSLIKTATSKLRMNLFCSLQVPLQPIITTRFKLQESAILIVLKRASRGLRLLLIVCAKPGLYRFKMWWIVGNLRISSADTNLLTVMVPWWISKLSSYQEKATLYQVCIKAS